MKPEAVEYVINANDVITDVNDAWRSFALENGGEALADGVVGSWLWQHLAGLQVKTLFRVLLDRVREGGKNVRIPFRCDAPEKRRYMLLQVTPLTDSGIRFLSWVEREEDRPHVRILEAGRETAPDQFLIMCAWCKRIGLGGEEWAELEDAIGKLELFQSDPLPQITHGVCRDCQAIVMRGMDAER